MMTQAAMTLWQTIDALAQQIPFSKARVETVLATHLVEKDTSGNPIKNTAFQFYTGGPVKLSDGVVIEKIDLRIRHKEGHPGFLSIDLAGNCVGIDTVRSHYDNLAITGMPRGDSLDEATYHSAFLKWGELSFGFIERNPKCLGRVILRPEGA